MLFEVSQAGDEKDETDEKDEQDEQDDEEDPPVNGASFYTLASGLSIHGSTREHMSSTCSFTGSVVPSVYLL